MKGLFEKMRIRHAHHALVYVSGIVLILSTFTDMKVLDNAKIATLALITLIYGVMIWSTWDFAELVPEEHFEEKYRAIFDVEKATLGLTAIYVLILIILIKSYI